MLFIISLVQSYIKLLKYKIPPIIDLAGFAISGCGARG
jgi:hypothetical protein